MLARRCRCRLPPRLVLRTVCPLHADTHSPFCGGHQLLLEGHACKHLSCKYILLCIPSFTLNHQVNIEINNVHAC